MSRVLWLLRSAHPEPAGAVTVVTALLAAVVGRGAAGIAAAAATVAASQLCVGWVNDWLDADRDAAVGRAGTPPWWMVLAGGLLGGGAHFVNVLPDIADDTRTGVRGLPQRLGPTGSWLAGGALLLAATAVLVFGPAGAPSWVGLGLLAVAVVTLPIGWYLSRRPGSRAPFRAVLIVALADVVLLLISGTGA